MGYIYDIGKNKLKTNFENFCKTSAVRQNDTGNEFFIIIEGTADITKTTANGTEHVGELGPRYRPLHFHSNKLINILIKYIK